jgi:hypothetical protein
VPIDPARHQLAGDAERQVALIHDTGKQIDEIDRDQKARRYGRVEIAGTGKGVILERERS